MDRFTLGIDSFAYHRFFGETTRWEAPLPTRWTTEDFLARARHHRAEVVSLQTCYLGALTAARIAELRPALGGMQPILAWGHPDGLQGGASAHAAADLLALLPLARALGCEIVRFVAGNHFTFTQDVDERIRQLAPIVGRAAAAAADHGLTLALENHADFVMRDLLHLIEQVDAPNLGICLDSGNAIRVGDDPVEAARMAAPLVRMVHLKDMRVQADSLGDPTRWWPCAPLGQGDLDIPAILNVLGAAGYRGSLLVELAPLHHDWHDEDAVVAESLAYLRGLGAGSAGFTPADR